MKRSLLAIELPYISVLLASVLLTNAQTGADRVADPHQALALFRQRIYSLPLQRKHLRTAAQDSSPEPLFLEAPSYPTGISPRWVAVADVNSDGKDDLVVANFCADNTCAQMGPSSISVLLGNGDGTFSNHVDYLTGVGSTSLAIADLNNDGKKDVAVANICSDSSCVASSISILSGVGDGTFQAHIDYATGTGALAVGVGDLNRDGTIDLVTADAFEAVSVLLGNGDGTFQSHVDYPTSACDPASQCTAPEAVVIADLNGDHKPDLASANYFGFNFSIFLGNGDGTFQPHSDQGPLGNASAIAAADLNGDGNIDIVTDDINNNIADAIAIFFGNGDGTFQPKAGYRTGGIGTGTKPAIAIADFTGRGERAIAINNVLGNSVSVFAGPGDGTFPSLQAWGTGSVPYAMAVGDFNGDGKADLVAVNVAENTASILLGRGDNTFVSRPDSDWFAGPSPSVADFNRDGKIDLIVSGGVYARLSLLLGNGDGTFQPRVDFDPVGGPTLTADFNRDGKPDFAAIVDCDSSCPSSFVRIYLGNGDGTFQPPVDYPVPSTPNSFASADFNSDGNPDLVVSYSSNPPVHGMTILLGSANGTFHTSTHVTNEGGGNVVAQDFNGDGSPDLAVWWADNLSVMLGNGDGTFRAPVDYPALSASLLTVGDLNSDNKPDLVTADSVFGNRATSESVFLGNGDGTFRPPVQYDAGAPLVWGLAIGDLDGDQRADLAVADGAATYVNIARGNGDGTFNPPSRYITGGVSEGLAIADFNGDGQPDIAAPNFYSASVLLNVAAEFPMFALSGSSLTPNPVMAGQSSSGTVNVNSVNGFSSSVSLSCSVSPEPSLAPQCSIVPSSVTPGTPATVTITTTAPSTALVSPSRGSIMFYALWLPVIGLAVLRIGSRQGKRAVSLTFMTCFLLLTTLLFQPGCAGDHSERPSKPGTPSGEYTITVTGTSGSLNRITTMTVTVQ